MRLMPAVVMVAATLSPFAALARTVEAIPSSNMPVIGTVPERCVTNDRLRVKGRSEVKSRKLGDLPPADEIKAVYRSKEGCPDPLVVRHGVGTPEPVRPGG